MKQQLIKLIPFKAQTLPIIFKCLRITSKLFPPKNDLLFAFSGRVNYWENMGRDFFEKEKKFRESILDSESIIKELGYPSILPNFKNNTPSINYFESESMIHLLIAVNQIAVFDYLKAKNIQPNAVFGTSLGEVVGIYAAGGISKTTTLKMLKSVIIISNIEKKEYLSVYFKMSMTALQKLSKEYDEIHPIHELGPDSTLAFVHQDKISELKSKLSLINIVFKPTGHKSVAYHTRLISNYEDDILKSYEDIELQPLKNDFFSGYLGTSIPKGTILPKRFFLDMHLNPVLADRTFKAIKSTNRRFDVVQIGPDIFGENHLKRELSDNSFSPNLLSTFVKGENAIKTLKATESLIRKKGVKNNQIIKNTNEFEAFKNNFNIYSTDYINNPEPFWKYFKANGLIHYIPKNNCWLSLSYDGIKHILKHPEHFSTKTSRSFDKYLIGADPISHKKMRTLLQPLFTQKTLKRIEDFASVKSQNLIANFPKGTDFNFVDYYSTPLTQSTNNYFMGLNSEQIKRMNSVIGDKVYDVHKQELLDYFSTIFTKNEPLNNPSVLDFLKKSYDKGELTLEAITSLSRLIWSAGVTTTNALLSNAFYRLVNNPYIINEIEGSDILINKFIDECLRLQPPEALLLRTAAQNTILSNVEIPENAIICLDLRAGNHDETTFSNPEQVDLSRPTNSNLSFGSGPHVCIGMAIAKIEARVAIKAYIDIIKSNHIKFSKPITYFPSAPFIAPEKMIVSLNKKQCL